MKKLLLFMLCIALIFTLLPSQITFAYDIPSQKGSIVSGQQYSGSLNINDYGLTMPDEYTLNIPQNSIIRIFAYTQVNDYYIELDSPDNPYASPDTYSSIPGSDVTQIFETSDRPGPQRFGTSCLGANSYKNNSSSYTEVFSNLVAGTYKLRIRGGPAYSFKVIIAPLKYTDDTPVLSNEDISTAMKINTDQDYEGNFMFNGVINKQFFYDHYDYYTFNAPTAGKYTVSFSTDGFFQGTASVLDATGSCLNDGIVEAYLKLATDGSEATTFENHVASAKTFTKEITIDKAGKYFILIAPYGAIAGSYKFNVASPASLNNDNNDEQGESEAIIQTLQIAPQTSTCKVGATVSLKATAIYSNGDTEVVSDFVEWSSSNVKIATVSEEGIVKAVSAGTADISGKLEGKTAKVKITVTGAQVKKILPLKASIYLKVGATGKNSISAQYSDGTKKDVTNQVTLASSSKCVIIYKNTTLKAMSKGTAKITVTFNGIKTSYTVVVK
jgi:hypothetical protein